MPADPFAEIVDLLMLVPEGNEEAVDAVRRHDAQLTKPPGSLGRLEELVEWLARWQGKAKPTLQDPMVAIFAGNHGVTDQGVSAFPREVTAQMVANFTEGGAAISQICAQHEFNLRVFELALDIPTGDFTQGPAMDDKTAAATVAYGMEAIAGKPDCLAIGEMGIGNTASAALLAHRLAPAPLDDCIGVGAGQSNEGLARKRAALVRAAARSNATAPLDVLAEFGGFEIAMMAGAVIGAASQRRPVIVDGFISSAAALVAIRLCPAARDYCVFAHRSAERGHGIVLDAMQAKPLLDLGLRLGEGTGALLALPLLRAAARLLTDVASLDDVLSGAI